MIRYLHQATVGLLFLAALVISVPARGESAGLAPVPASAPAEAAGRLGVPDRAPAVIAMATPDIVRGPASAAKGSSATGGRTNAATVVALFITPTGTSAAASTTTGTAPAAAPGAASGAGAGTAPGTISAPVTGPAVKPAAAPAAAPAPRAEVSFNAATIYGDQVLNEDTVWRGTVLVEGVVAVAPQATLTVEPGTVVRFRRKGKQAPLIVVQGRLVAVGTKETPVLFASTFAAPAPGDWQGIMLLGSDKKNVLENCRIEGAETGVEALFSNLTLKGVRVEHAGTGMRFQDALVAIESGAISDSETALRFCDSEATLRNVSLVENRLGLTALHSSLYLYESNVSGTHDAAFSADSSRVKIQGGTVVGNGSGVTLIGCEGSITGARLAKNREFGLSLSTSRIRVTGNVISGNGNNGMMVADGAAVAWDNAILENAGYDLYNAGVEEFKAPANWWGSATPKIFDNGGRGRVLYTPLLSARPKAEGR